MKGRHHSKATRKKMSKAKAGKRHPLFGKKHSNATRKKMSKANSGENHPMWGKKLSEIIRRKIGRAQLGNTSWLGKRHTEITRSRMSKTKKKLFRNIEYKTRILREARKALHIRPNKPEKLLYKSLQKAFSKQWEYVGDGKFWLGGKNPDFVNKKKKRIIEMAGAYWHDKGYPRERRRIFSKYGFKTLVIWESQLKNLDKVLERVQRFTNVGLDPKTPHSR
jgi:very-short-patch-repair endonuclease